ncbi:Chloride channel protein 2 [Strongyloides ratti]|uniref:Chloride channel protein n=1 Tax=Strongyloides ratti TaxID=34506 RepID=A0A090MWH1_STRRB|nr:Chloride channel protein 2 [Strongyloides ratti]CEF63729.1 Chloride channel protein 2 [Strongyloides ratti]
MSGILKKEFENLERSYSYENTVQLGRFRIQDDNDLAKIDEEDEDKNIERRKSKSVRFDSFDPREEWKQEKRARSWSEYFKRFSLNFNLGSSMFHFRDLLTDWICLAALGIISSFLSIIIDKLVDKMQIFQRILKSLTDIESDFFFYEILGYIGWTFYTVALVLSAASYVHTVAPQAIGSGLPEMKTILRGVVLKDFLTLKTLLSKVVGLVLILGSGIPVGKMGPFVHIAAIIANLISNLAKNFDSAFANEARKTDMLAAGCAVGVACTFSAPIGGVLFSIEVTTMYFSVRNYWRGFFAAACGATVFRLLKMTFLESEVTLLAFYQTNFPKDSFVAEELILFAILGFFCGIIGVCFVGFYKNLVMVLRTNKFAKKLFQKHWIAYPSLIAFIVASITYPRGYGRFLTGRFKFTRTLVDLFANCTWHKDLKSVDSPHGCNAELISGWSNQEGLGPYNVLLVLTIFTISFLILSALCNSMPIPCGMFMPVFVCGAAFGRLFGEIVSQTFPEGISEMTDQPIFPGIYAVVGAAALTGAITHSVSVVVICCELTGQVIYLIPLMIAVLVANGVATYFKPSIYDVIIKIKHLPYLPEIPPSNSILHMISAEHIMVSPVEFLPRKVTYEQIKEILIKLKRVRAFPVVDNQDNMILLGSVSRRFLLDLLNNVIGEEARKKEAERRIKLAISTIDRHFKEAAFLATLKSTVIQDQNNDKSLPQNKSDSRLNDRKISCPETKNSFKRITSIFNNRKNEFLSDSNEDLSKGRFIVEPVDGIPTFTDKDINVLSSRKPGRRNAYIAKINNEEFENDSKELESNTITGSNSDCKKNMRQKSSSFHQTSSDNDLKSYNTTITGSLLSHHDSELSLSKYFREAKKKFHSLQFSVFNGKHDDNLKNISFELDSDEIIEFENRVLKEETMISDNIIDAAPFQLVRRTSLFKVHSLFSLLGLSRAYVTDCGRLIGVVALKDLRIAIQKAQSAVNTKHIRKLHRRMSINMDSDSNTSEIKEPGPYVPSAYKKNDDEQCEYTRQVKEERNLEPSSSAISLHDILTPPLEVVQPPYEEISYDSAHNSIHKNCQNTMTNDYNVDENSKDCISFDVQNTTNELDRAISYLRRKSIPFDEQIDNETDK